MREPDDRSFSRQSSLTTSSGRRWLFWGGILAAVLVGVLLTLTPVRPATALTGAACVVALYIVMLVVRFGVRSQRARLVTLAIVTTVMAATALAFVAFIGTPLDQAL